MATGCVLFDHDDTLLPTFELRRAALAAVMAELLERPPDAGAFLVASQGESLEQISGRLCGGDADLAARLVREYRRHYARLREAGVAPFAGIAELLDGLATRGVRLAVVTSKLGDNARHELRHSGLLDRFEAVVTAEDVSRHKPEPEPLLRALELLRMPPESALMVGDTRADLLGARAAGVRSGAALWGTQDRETLLALAPDHIFRHPAEVLAVG